MIAAFRAGHPIGWDGMYPLLQQIPGTALKLLGFDDTSAQKWLVGCNLAAFAGLLIRAWRGSRPQSRRVATLLVFVLVSSPLLWYAHSSFGEMLAAFFTLGFAADCGEEETSDSRIFVDGFLAGIAKDTAFPFLLLLGTAASFCRLERCHNRDFAIARGKLLLVVAVSGAAMNAGFNYLRFRSVLNPILMNPLFRVHSLKQQTSFFLGLWASPNGGILLFWPSFCFLLVLAAVAARRSFRAPADRYDQLASAIPILGVSASLLGLTLGFSRWAFPMGWFCWGPRFLIPWVPALAWLLCYAYARPLDELLRRLSEPAWRAAAVGAALALVTAPQFAVLFRPNILVEFFAPDVAAGFPKVAIIQEDVPHYFRYIDHLLWTRRSLLREAYSRQPASEFLPTLGCSLALLFFWLSGQSWKHRERPVPSPP